MHSWDRCISNPNSEKTPPFIGEEEEEEEEEEEVGDSHRYIPIKGSTHQFSLSSSL
jgi:hypothetical protein